MPATVHLVIGGCRSGKSSYAQSLCEMLRPPDDGNDKCIYVATSGAWDEDFAARVERHRSDRDESRWTTIEEPLYPSVHVDSFRGGRIVLVDCITLWLTNFFVECGAFGGGDDRGVDVDVGVPPRAVGGEALIRIKDEFEKLIAPWDATFVFVTNEIGSGLHAEVRTTREFVDAHGWFNQHVAGMADAVVHMVAGIPNYVKRPTSYSSHSTREYAMSAAGGGGLDPDDLSTRVMLDGSLSTRSLVMDDGGYFVIKVDVKRGVIRATYHPCTKNDDGDICDVHGVKIGCHDNGGDDKGPDPTIAFEGRTAKELTIKIFEKWERARDLVSVGHAAYIGREAQRAEGCLYAGRFYQQD
ncbi:hypothetical protein ACHAXA_005814 [Cyclostephanos tholiformis]|uniref:Adenosylcobinamide kinase n=1 Tax=Cyclostephanos tholiformis TaxID=382380 RepID=A0ABD3R9H3_9STRA